MRLARGLLPRGPVVGLTRSEASAEQLDAQGIDAVVWDLDVAESALPRGFGTPSVVFYLVPPPSTGATRTSLRSAATCSPARVAASTA
ncbi:MAG TPA: hypothetical protein VET66_09275 [Steroidobacteraceae bacterium]|nr:hypothetical protein [Steroidobacteraceae bacterium]